jgi:hypothetical protein
MLTRRGTSGFAKDNKYLYPMIQSLVGAVREFLFWQTK